MESGDGSENPEDADKIHKRMYEIRKIALAHYLGDSIMIVPIWTLNTDRSRPLSERRVIELMERPSIHDPIIVDTDGSVIDGAHRLAARKRLGLLHVEVRYGDRSQTITLDSAVSRPLTK